VTVYPDRAAVQRVVESLRLEPGRNEALIRGLPGSVDPSSVRAEGRGSPGVILANVDVAAGVSQRTGEAWLDVALTLCTAQPSLGADVPDLSPWWLAVPQPANLFAQETGPAHGQTIRVVDTRAPSKIRAINTTEEAIASAPPLEPIEWRTMVAAHGITTSFATPSRQDLPSDGRARRLRLGKVSMEARVSHQAVPKLAPCLVTRSDIRDRGWRSRRASIARSAWGTR
jgi:hypothetical protein